MITVLHGIYILVLDIEIYTDFFIIIISTWEYYTIYWNMTSLNEIKLFLWFQ